MEKTPYYVHIYVLHLILLPGIKEKSIVNKNIQRENIYSHVVLLLFWGKFQNIIQIMVFAWVVSRHFILNNTQQKAQIVDSLTAE